MDYFGGDPVSGRTTKFSIVLDRDLPIGYNGRCSLSQTGDYHGSF